MVRAPDQATVQRCKQQIVWSAESQASLADLECRVEEATDRAAAGKVNVPDSNARRSACSTLWGYVQGARKPQQRLLRKAILVYLYCQDS